MIALRASSFIRDSVVLVRHPGGRLGALRLAALLAIPVPFAWALLAVHLGAPGLLLAFVMIASTYYGGAIVGSICWAEGIVSLFYFSHRGHSLPTSFSAQSVAVSALGGAVCVFLGDRLLWRQRRANERLRVSEEGFRRLLSESHTGLALVDPVRRVIEYANQTLCELSGYSADELVGLSPAELMRDGKLTILDHPELPRLLSGELSSLNTSAVAIRRNGEEAHLDVVALAVAGADGRPRLLTSVEDRTAGLFAERRLRAQAAMLDRIQEIGRTGYWIWDPETGRSEWSLQARRIYGFDDDLASGPGELFAALVVAEDRPALFEARDRALTTGRSELEFRIRRADGVRLLHDESEVEYDADGVPRRIVGIVRDVTDWHELAEQLRRAEKLEALGALAGGIAHDFNNLLQVVVGNAEAALGSLDRRDVAARHHLESLVAATDSATGLVRQLLDFAGSSVAGRKRVDLNEIVRTIERMLPHLVGENIAVDVQTTAQPACVLGDPAGLEQVLLNLAVNGRDAMPNGGRLSISVGGSNGEVQLRVADSGVGIDSATRERIFDPLFTTKAQGWGTGLGLATVSRIVTQLGGTIDVESTPGAGTVFLVRVPRADA